jgi:hypothetical protein
LFAVVGFDETEFALQPASELFDRGALRDGAGDEVGFQRAQHGEVSDGLCKRRV